MNKDLQPTKKRKRNRKEGKRVKKARTKLIDILGFKNKQMKNKLELDTNAPSWAFEIQKESPRSLEIFYMLFIRCIRRTIPSKSGQNGIKDIISMQITDEEFLPFAKHFAGVILPNFRESKLNSSHYPYTGDKFDEIVFEMIDTELVEEFFSIFQNLKPALEICWIRDQIQSDNVIRIDNPRQKMPCLLNRKLEKERKKYIIDDLHLKRPIMTRLTVRIGEIEGRTRYCPFRIIYTRDMEPHYPGGTLKLSYSYEYSTNGILKDMVVEGEAIPKDAELPTKKDLSKSGARKKKEKEKEEAIKKIQAIFANL
jgi:hypothetical protein